jgi:hypothetical protein
MSLTANKKNIRDEFGLQQRLFLVSCCILQCLYRRIHVRFVPKTTCDINCDPFRRRCVELFDGILFAEYLSYMNYIPLKFLAGIAAQHFAFLGQKSIHGILLFTPKSLVFRLDVCFIGQMGTI